MVVPDALSRAFVDVDTYVDLNEKLPRLPRQEQSPKKGKVG